MTVKQDQEPEKKFKATSRKCLKCDNQFIPKWWTNVLCDEHELEDKFVKAGGDPGGAFGDMFGDMFKDK